MALLSFAQANSLMIFEKGEVISYLDAAGEERIGWRQYAKPELLGKTADEDRTDTAINGRFNWENHEAFQRMRRGGRDAWASLEHRLGDRDRELRERDG